MSAIETTLKGMSARSSKPARPLRLWLVYAGACVLVLYVLRQGLRFVSPDCKRQRQLPLSTKMPYPSAGACNHAISPDMELLQVQYVLRHGARYANDGEIDRMLQVFELLSDHVPKSWIKPEMVAKEKAMHLSVSGHIESSNLAQRMQQRYSALLARRQKNIPTVRFISTEFQRTIATANSFRNALDAHDQMLPVAVIPLANDTLLSMKTNCGRWDAGKNSVQAAVNEEQAIFDSIHGAKLQGRISRQLGIAPSALSVDDIQIIYRICGYDMALYDEHTHWCTLFDQPTAALLELRSDIKYSREYGSQGAEINGHMACALFTSIVNDIDSALRDPSTAVSTFGFGHAETLMFVNNLLGLDQALGQTAVPISGNMTLEQGLRRGFRTTKLVPFSSNLGIELYRDQDSQAFFRLLLNERVVRLPGCAEDLCPLGVLRSKLAGDIGCPFTDMCQL
ncbi:hypothetical protein H4S02_000245 [Coemansia sp. RSA 2611]|nr:hypothetical protein IWW54_000531 [Coemansia sp. RSA 2705]KAJ2321901.1 hypothetical protein IWW52_000443 [Coemansia sp. RSA 2704]KAJ2329607.1 hypothetical protein IWW51_000497 [Coemansia sp. RSA 2702]KAJ2393379.1 hypothetical protein H4S02_000245 [Coemansia sp. RSA 2611]KAJ2739564.1 hypothetical protein H4R23_000376 [Coemansia sp. Cherry 401B]